MTLTTYKTHVVGDGHSPWPLNMIATYLGGKKLTSFHFYLYVICKICECVKTCSLGQPHRPVLRQIISPPSPNGRLLFMLLRISAIEAVRWPIDVTYRVSNGSLPTYTNSGLFPRKCTKGQANTYCVKMRRCVVTSSSNIACCVYQKYYLWEVRFSCG